MSFRVARQAADHFTNWLNRYNHGKRITDLSIALSHWIDGGGGSDYFAHEPYIQFLEVVLVLLQDQRYQQGFQVRNDASNTQTIPRPNGTDWIPDRDEFLIGLHQAQARRHR